jgi:hypothetical protein
MDIANKLSDCPFCGGIAIVVDMNSNRFHIQCQDCPARLGEVWGDDESIDYLIDKWNNRRRFKMREQIVIQGEFNSITERTEFLSELKAISEKFDCKLVDIP